MKINTSSDHFLIKKSDFKDLFNIMKICLFLLFAFAFQLMATNTNAQLESPSSPDGFSRHRSSLRDVTPASLRMLPCGSGNRTRENALWRSFPALQDTYKHPIH